eukprot:TRINITY_DN2744_c0_g1_i1.p1 TRINITY_DN2744_c0_g1~~TRINITY_DN2744_c0_g1_i1.p1  ORF type:complete len:169 (-),score=11.12 TRINITY_DN2744_c0_g1_i1:369-875(-)
MIRRPPRSTQSRSSAASDVYKRQINAEYGELRFVSMADSISLYGDWPGGLLGGRRWPTSEVWQTPPRSVRRQPPVCATGRHEGGCLHTCEGSRDPTISVMSAVILPPPPLIRATTLCRVEGAFAQSRTARTLTCPGLERQPLAARKCHGREVRGTRVGPVLPWSVRAC